MTKPIRILITGASGFVGVHLSRVALTQGASVFGLSRSGKFAPGILGYKGDITNPHTVESVVADARPDWVFHLVALIPGTGEFPPEDYLSINVCGTYFLLDALRHLCPTSRVLVASSSAVYGQPLRPGQPVDETAPIRPQSLYATSKASQELLAGQFFREYGLHTVCTRAFNQIGPGEPTNLVCATLARQIARIEAGQQESVVRARSLVPRRDFTDVRDVAAGYWASLDCGIAGQVYNICSGRTVAIRRIVETLMSLSTTRGLSVFETDSMPRSQGVLELVGNASRLHACSGWRPTISLEQSLQDLLDEWRVRVLSGH